ncbi:HNH endonuclease signature motif containing protein [Mycobacterium sp. E1319]|uniref:HNH endonuclease signature motif containing protein n=1 Tax=Mycobacterium sp. E1319 TaxID=1834124 RepID=UPI00080035FD|nr:HNH endonuclease signature motif containing protein [Mycobacterium sp. E1319]OBH29271.1 hypothetical protein A5693_20170 [Mycobacterium sp. E1319]
MFEEVHERFDEMVERLCPSATEESTALLDQACAAGRAENRAAAAQLAVIGRLFRYRLARCADTEDWAVDTEAAVAAEVAAALRISPGLAASKVRYARAMRERLPGVAAVFLAGDIDCSTFQTVVFRTDLITDAEVLAVVDAQLAARVGRWPSLTRGRLAAAVDKVVAHADVDAVRRRRERAAGREIWIGDMGDGLARIEGSLFGPDARALDQRLDALAATVCPHDPRTAVQRRADALGALAAGADRLGCRCGRADCAAGDRPAPGPVIIHVIAHAGALSGAGAPGVQIGGDGLLPPELLAELAASAKRVPLVHPADARAEPGYSPSKALSDYVRCRDLTCRAPGCDRPATECDIDHTIPYARGGATHASNLKVLCRQHHLLKTFWGWRDRQLPDGTVIWTLPGARTYVTTPGSAVLFPELCARTADLPAPRFTREDRCAPRGAMMPRRRRTRAQDRALRVATERRRNHHARAARRAGNPVTATPADDGHDPPPF